MAIETKEITFEQEIEYSLLDHGGYILSLIHIWRPPSCLPSVNRYIWPFPFRRYLPVSTRLQSKKASHSDWMI